MAKNQNTIESLFNYLAFYSDLLPVLFFLFFWKKSKSNKGLWIIFAYIGYDYLTNTGIVYLPSIRPVRVFLYSAFTFVEYFLFAWFLYTVIKSKIFKKIIVSVSIAFIAFLIFYYLFAKAKSIDSIPIGIETILILIFSFYYLYEQIQDTETLFIYTKYPFWIIIGMLIYLSGSFFIYIYASYLPTKEIAKYWIFTNVFAILKNIFFAIAIIVNAGQSTKKPKDKFKMHTLN